MNTAAHNITTRRILLGLLLCVLALPGLVGITGLVKEEPVEGAWITPSAPDLTVNNVLSGDFQREYELWRNENTGFHYSFIRLRNQLWYTLFKTNCMPDAVIGNSNQLYLKGYINAYMGTDYIGEDAISTMTYKLKTLQDTLEKHGVTLIVVMAPGKANIYPEGIPSAFGPRLPLTNQSVMRHQFDSAGVNLIDFNTYFADKRNELQYPVYSNTSVHWTNYAALEAMDSIIRYIEWKRHIDMPEIIYDGIVWSDTTREYDNDVGGGLNLIFPVKNIPMGYPRYHYGDTTGKTKIRLMSIADSYIRMMMAVGLTENLTTTHDYWYYNQGVEHSDGRPKNSVLDEDIASQTLSHDVVLIMATELNFAGFSWGYINDAYRAVVLKQPMLPEERRIRELENDIRMSKKWLFQVQQKANARRIPLDSMIRMDAVFQAQEEMKAKSK